MSSTVAAVATGDHLFWLASRAAGTAALLTSSAAVCVGLTMGGRMVKRRGADLRVLHEALSLATIIALVVHAVTLLGDSYLAPSLAGITIPFAGGYAEPWNGIGIIAGWAMIALGLSYYFRTRIGVARWRVLHRFTALAWVLGVVHTLGEGTDAGTAWFVVLCALAVVPAAVLLVARLAGARLPTRAPEVRHAR
jgi:methionine sulfoxide reductase heme-binding subunit